MEHPTLKIGSFGLMLRNDRQDRQDQINLTSLTKNFKTDVVLNNRRTFLIQDGDGSKPVSKSNISMCSVNKKLDYDRPTGFVKIQYSRLLKNANSEISEIEGRRTITRPPVGPIPIGAWCTICKERGPYFHTEKCNDPVESSLKITLLGFIACVVEGSTNFDDEDIKGLSSLLSDSNTKEEYIETYTNSEFLDKFEIDNDDIDGWPLLNIRYTDVIKSSKEKSYFSNCSIISYNFDDSSVSVRVYKNGLIHFVSCPWSEKDFYKEVVDRINETVGDNDDYIIDSGESLVTTVFSSFTLFEDPTLQLNLEKLYNYLWPVDANGLPTLNKISPKRIFTKKYTYSGKEIDHTYLKFKDEFYRYDISYRSDLSTPKIIMKLIPCVVNESESGAIPKYCKHYKITFMIFNSGKIQSIFSYCKDDDNESENLCDSTIEGSEHKNISEQYSLIEKELNDAMDFFHNCIKKTESEIIEPINTKYSNKRDMINTVSGTHPYKKKKLLKVGDQVDIFNENIMGWDQSGEITKINKVDGSNKYNVSVDDGRETLNNLDFTDIRATKQSAMQIARSKIAGTEIENKPNPYSFHSKCSGGNNFYVPFGGRQARDNLYYPYCATKNKDKYNLYIDRILEGFPGTDDEEEFKITRDSEDFDIYSGMLENGSTEIGSNIEFLVGETEYAGVITDKHRTKNNKYDNTVIYTVKVSEDEIFDIEGKDFLPKYRQSRRWEGLNNNKKSKLLNCAKNLGLTQPKYTEIQDSELQEDITEKIGEILDVEPSTFFGKNTSVLTPSTINKMTLSPYIGIGFPENSQRVLMYCTKDQQYFIDEYKMLLKLKISVKKHKVTLLDGYLHKRNGLLVYYPMDCIIYKGEKLKMDYFTYDPDDEDEDDDSIENSRLLRTIYLAKKFQKNNSNDSIKIMNPLDYVVPFLGKVDIVSKKVKKINLNKFTEGSIIADTYKLMKKDKNSNLVFIPQTGDGNYLQWERTLRTPIILKLGKKVKGGYEVGIGKKSIEPFGKKSISISSDIIKKLDKGKSNYLRFDLNFMDNKLNPEDPLTLDIIAPIASKDDMLTHRRTQSIINAMVSPIPESMFMSNTKWKLPGMVLTVSDDQPGINPLITAPI
jgi:hypothetical protein